MKVKIKKVYEDVFVPTRGSEQAAGYDLYAHLGGFEECEIKPGTTMRIGTGIAAEIPDKAKGHYNILIRNLKTIIK